MPGLLALTAGATNPLVLDYDEAMITRYEPDARNVLGGPLEPFGLDPVTGFYRNGCCETGAEDVGMHTVCAIMTADFLAFSKSVGNDLSTPMPQYGFPGLQPGDKVIALNEAIKQFADENKFYYLDLYSSVVDDNKGMKKEYANDGVHPTVEGYKVIEPLIEAAIRKVRK
jgi:uncharacterized protein (DUF2237 family)